MRLPRPRLTVRRLMAVVAMLAFVLAGVKAREHHQRCMSIAAAHEIYRSVHEANEAELLSIIAAIRKPAAQNGRLTSFLQDATEPLEKRLSVARASIEYESQLKTKYERAALRFWEGILPDPPPPDPGVASRFWLGGGEYARALAACTEAIEDEPADSRAYNLQAWILATCPVATFRNGKAAVESATTACKLSRWKNPNELDTLAAAYAEHGNFAQAVEWQQKVFQLVPVDSPDRKGYLERLELYRAGRPYRDEPTGR